MLQVSEIADKEGQGNSFMRRCVRAQPAFLAEWTLGLRLCCDANSR